MCRSLHSPQRLRLFLPPCIGGAQHPRTLAQPPRNPTAQPPPNPTLPLPPARFPLPNPLLQVDPLKEACPNKCVACPQAWKVVEGNTSINNANRTELVSVPIFFKEPTQISRMFFKQVRASVCGGWGRGLHSNPTNPTFKTSEPRYPYGGAGGGGRSWRTQGANVCVFVLIKSAREGVIPRHNTHERAHGGTISDPSIHPPIPIIRATVRRSATRGWCVCS